MRKKKRKKLDSKFIRILFLFVVLIIIFKLAPNYKINDGTYIKNKINLIIDNINQTSNLKYDIFLDEDNVIYMSKEDIAVFFDKDIRYEEKKNKIITTYGEKIVELPLNENIIIINNRKVDVLSGAIKKEDVYYIPITEIKSVYEVDLEYIENENIILLDLLTKKLVKADVSKKCDVKYKDTAFSKTVDKLKRGEKVICIEKSDNNWTKIRTKNGKIGYIKTNVLQNERYIRKDLNV